MTFQSDTSEKGFTFIELSIALTIISILAAIAVPNFSVYRDRAYLTDAWTQCYSLRQTLEEYYSWHGSFPRDNRQAGLAEPEALATNYLSSITVENGALHLVWGNRAPQSRHGEIMIIQPWISQTGSNEVIIWRSESSRSNVTPENKKMFKAYGIIRTSPKNEVK